MKGLLNEPKNQVNYEAYCDWVFPGGKGGGGIELEYDPLIEPPVVRIAGISGLTW